MYDFKITKAGTIEFKVDQSIYSDAVTSKVLYWLAVDFIIERKITPSREQHILMRCKKLPTDETDFSEYEEMISRMFLDFKVRELVRKETEDIRNILYLKAFAGCPDLEDLRESE